MNSPPPLISICWIVGLLYIAGQINFFSNKQKKHPGIANIILVKKPCRGRFDVAWST